MNEHKGIMQTKIELTLEQSQQGVSNDVLVRIKGVKELKRNVWIKGENKAALQTPLGRSQKNDGIYISQDKYVADILKKFDFTTVKTTSTPIEPDNTLIKDAEAKDVDVHLYRLMIGLLMYLTASRPDIMFVVCVCASLDRKSTTGGCQFLGKRLISWKCKKQTIVANSTTKAEYVATANYCGQVLWIQN
nr:ribonuclease H-like domain, reverse transcriptase, RNA-dependent DNA polymerase [Tanacetum cinerariifolium]